MRSLQSEIEQRGRRIFELVDKHPESLFSKAGFYQRLMTISMRDEQLKLQLFRFVDVLPSLCTSGEVIEHLQEYFAEAHDSRKLSEFLRAGIRLARIVPRLSGPILRWTVSEMARQFIVGQNFCALFANQSGGSGGCNRPSRAEAATASAPCARAGRFHQFRHGKLCAQKYYSGTIQNHL